MGVPWAAMTKAPHYERHDSYEVYGFSDPTPFLITCEHASNRVPSPLRTNSQDRDWLRTHWGWDIGARSVCREVIRRTRSRGVFARYSRLICDANRAPDDPTLVLCAVEGCVLSFNAQVSVEEIDRRLVQYHEPYHTAVDKMMADSMRQTGQTMLLAVHSFTPQLGDEIRTMDIGVLFHPFENIARRLAGEIEAEGYTVAYNEPYSGREGRMYAAMRHGSKHDSVFLELELNQKLIDTPAGARKVGAALSRALTRLKWRGR